MVGRRHARRPADATANVEQGHTGAEGERLEQVLGGGAEARVELVQTGQILDPQGVDVDSRGAKGTRHPFLEVVAAVVTAHEVFRIHVASELGADGGPGTFQHDVGGHRRSGRLLLDGQAESRKFSSPSAAARRAN